MIKITAGLGKNRNIIKASEIVSQDDNIEVNLVENERELIDAIKNKDVDAVIRGSLAASNVIKSLKSENPSLKINRGTYIHSKDHEFLILPVGIDEGQSIEDTITLVEQGCEFLLKINKEPKIAILSGGRSDDFNRTKEIDKTLKESQLIEKRLKSEFSKDERFNNTTIKNYYILIEKAIKENNNILLAPNGIIGNYIFRILVLLCNWPSYGGITLGIDDFYIDTSRDQTTEGYVRILKFAARLAENKKEN